MRQLLIILTTASVFWSSNVMSATCSHRIIFLPQTHQMQGESRTTYSTDMEPIAESQYRIAKYIERHRSVAVFSEQAADTDYDWYDLTDRQRETAKNVIATVFPRGLPNDFSEMTSMQRWKMVANGADFIELMRQHVPVIHKVIADRETANNIFSQTDEWFRENPGQRQLYSQNIAQLIFDTRERFALDEINKYFKNHPADQDVILMFGADHRFNVYPDKFPPACVIIPEDFVAEWQGGESVAAPQMTNIPKTQEDSANATR